jgi:hypothetical protein
VVKPVFGADTRGERLGTEWIAEVPDTREKRDSGATQRARGLDYEDERNKSSIKTFDLRALANRKR